MTIIPFNELEEVDLIIDCIYEGGQNKNSSDDPITKLLPVGNSGGFRIYGKKPNYQLVVLYTSGEEVDWPDRLNPETGLFTYYGDNRIGNSDTPYYKKKGNQFLEFVFEQIESDNRENIPPILIFKKSPTEKSNRAVRFLGLAIPGSPDKMGEQLAAVWRTQDGSRFQNYVAQFSILDTRKPLSRNWILNIKEGNPEIEAPPEWIEWRNGQEPKILTAPGVIDTRSINEQTPETILEWDILHAVYDYFGGIEHPYEFEKFSVWLVSNFLSPLPSEFKVTQKSRDGGYDAIGYLYLGPTDDQIAFDVYVEAKCYNPGSKGGENRNTVGVKETARLISRIRNRQMGVLVTTSVINKTAYEEVRKDNHPIIFLVGKDIVNILRNRGHLSTKQEVLRFLEREFHLA